MCKEKCDASGMPKGCCTNYTRTKGWNSVTTHATMPKQLAGLPVAGSSLGEYITGVRCARLRVLLHKLDRALRHRLMAPTVRGVRNRCVECEPVLPGHRPGRAPLPTQLLPDPWLEQHPPGEWQTNRRLQRDFLPRDLPDRSIGSDWQCLAQANPFLASIVGGRCKCTPPAQCG